MPKDHKRRCTECQSRCFLSVRERSVLHSFFGLKGGKPTALNHEEIKSLATIIAKRCRDQPDIDKWEPNWKDIASEFFEIKNASDKKVKQLRYLWKINFLSVKDICRNVVSKSSDNWATPDFSNRDDRLTGFCEIWTLRNCEIWILRNKKKSGFHEMKKIWILRNQHFSQHL